MTGGCANTKLVGHAVPVLICGATGSLGRAFARLCRRRGLAFVLLSRQEVDIADRASVELALDLYKPWAVINAAGYVRVDDAESDAQRCFRENTLGSEILAAVCAMHHVALVIFSSDLVFGGDALDPYVETDKLAPLNIYGHSKAEAEKKVMMVHPEPLIVRSSAFFGPWDAHNFVSTTLASLQCGEPVQAADDIVVSPTYLPDLVNVTLDLLIDRATGIWHLSNGNPMTWAELAVKTATIARCDISLIQSCSNASLNLPAVRPAYSALTSERGLMMPSFESAFERFFSERVAE